MAEQHERITEYLDGHVGQKLDIKDLARQLGTTKPSLKAVISNFFTHRLEPPTGRSRVILPADGSDPTSRGNADRPLDSNEPSLRFVPGLINTRHQSSAETEGDKGIQ